MSKVISKDGTPIVFDREGQGPALIMVSGATASREYGKGSASELAQHFTVFNYDRRGRGESGDADTYAVEREIEDIDVLITEAGGSAFLFGHSSGAVLALEAARLLPGRVTKLALYEPPFIIDDSRPPLPGDYQETLNTLIAAGRRGDALEYFMTRAVGMPAEHVTAMRNAPMWETFEKVAPTLRYDAAIMGDTMRGNPESIKKWASVSVPTLVMDGGASPWYMQHSAEELANLLPQGQHRRLPGQDHGPSDELLIPALVQFLKNVDHIQAGTR